MLDRFVIRAGRFPFPQFSNEHCTNRGEGVGGVSQRSMKCRLAQQGNIQAVAAEETGKPLLGRSYSSSQI